MELSSCKIKKFNIFFQKKLLLYFGKLNFLENFLYFSRKLSKFITKKSILNKLPIFSEIQLSSRKLKKLLHLRREVAKPEKQNFPIFLYFVFIPHFRMTADEEKKEKRIVFYVCLRVYISWSVIFYIRNKNYWCKGNSQPSLLEKIVKYFTTIFCISSYIII